MFFRSCDACGKPIFLYDEVDGFEVCKKCGAGQKASQTPMVDFVAKRRAETKAKTVATKAQSPVQTKAGVTGVEDTAAEGARQPKPAPARPRAKAVASNSSWRWGIRLGLIALACPVLLNMPMNGFMFLLLLLSGVLLLVGLIAGIIYPSSGTPVGLRFGCDLCGNFALGIINGLRSIDGFAVCKRCRRVAIRNGGTFPPEAIHNTPRRLFSADLAIVLLLAAGLGTGGYFFFFAPEKVRIPGFQPSIAATVRPSLVIGNVLVIGNGSRETLTGVKVRVKDSGANAWISRDVGDIPPGDYREVGTVDWNWEIEKNHRITVFVDNYWPMVFTGEQLGVK
jgi:DNA-directed RNA polymerase subunit M/transcription elongation factor TFIIS